MDEALIAAARTKLYSAVISDVLDTLGNRHQALHPRIRPLDDTLVLFGRVRTALYAPITRGARAQSLRTGDHADRQPQSRRRRGDGLPRREPDRALG